MIGKNLIIHIGYPKTATTTLQFSLFTDLHKAKEINFLGKVPKIYRNKKIILLIIKGKTYINLCGVIKFLICLNM